MSKWRVACEDAHNAISHDRQTHESVDHQAVAEWIIRQPCLCLKAMMLGAAFWRCWTMKWPSYEGAPNESGAVAWSGDLIVVLAGPRRGWA